MYKKQTVRLNYCEIHEQNLSKSVFKKYPKEIKNDFLNNFEKTTAISLKQIYIIIVIKRKLVFFSEPFHTAGLGLLSYLVV